MRAHIRKKVAMLMFCDFAAMLVSFVLALVFGHQPPVGLHLVSHYQWGIVTLFSITFVVFIIFEVYSLLRIPGRFLQQVLFVGLGLSVSAVLSTAAFYFFRDAVPRAVFIIYYICSFGLITAIRYIISLKTLLSIHWRVLIVGDGKRSSEVAQVISSRAYLRTAVVGYVSRGTGSQAQDMLPHLGSIQDLVLIAGKRAIDQVIVAVPSLDDDLMKRLLECMQRKIKVSDFRTVIEEITGKVPIDHLNDNWFILGLSTLDMRYFWYVKRSFDIVVSCVGLCLALPFLPLIALLIKLDSRGPVFYSQQRIGRDNIPFRAWKLRTMVDGADKNNVHWTMDNDDRVTRAGKWIRRTRMDEAPQLLNIVKGEMSLIGPRPEAASLVDLYSKEIPYYRERHIVTPGITGWAQINYGYGNSIEDTRQKLMYDFYYVKNRSIALDLMILLRTIRTVLTGKGAV